MAAGNGRVVTLAPNNGQTAQKPFLPTGLSQGVPPASDNTGPGIQRPFRIGLIMEARVEAVAKSGVSSAKNFSEAVRLALAWYLEICEPALQVGGFSNLALDIREYIDAAKMSAEIDMQDAMFATGKKFCEHPNHPGAIEEAERIAIRLSDPTRRDELHALITVARSKRK
jgi:hypothetical protein